MADKLKQEEVLKLMREGWSCSRSHGSGRDSGWWTLQHGKLGYGGDTKHPHGQTMNALVTKKLIIGLPYVLASFRTEYVLAEKTDQPNR